MKKLLCLSLVMAFCSPAFGASERKSSFSGSISVREEYDSNTNLTENNEQDAWYTVISPAFTYSSEGTRDSFSLSYAPGLRYDNDREDAEMDHHLALLADKQFTSRFGASLRETYIRSNDYTYYVTAFVQEVGAGIPLSEERRRRTYWTNGVQVDADYQYAKDSRFTVGYAHYILEDDSPGADNYVRSSPRLSIEQRLSAFWSGGASYEYIEGDFDRSEDLQEHTVGLNAAYRMAEQDRLVWNYFYSTLDYQGVRNDYQLHTGTMGWEHGLDPHTTLTLSGGASYLDQDNADSQTAVNYVVLLQREIQRGSIVLGGRGGMDELNFNTDADGVSEYWSLNADITYQLQQYLSTSLYASYRVDDFLERPTLGDETSYVAGLQLAYDFWRWYGLAIGYSYRERDADRPGADYQDHRAYVELRAGKELARW